MNLYRACAKSWEEVGKVNSRRNKIYGQDEIIVSKHNIFDSWQNSIRSALSMIMIGISRKD